MKWILWLTLTVLIGYATLRLVLAAVISSKTQWVGGSGFFNTVTTYGVADMAEALTTENPDA